jgi:hypothetical protein
VFSSVVFFLVATCLASFSVPSNVFLALSNLLGTISMHLLVEAMLHILKSVAGVKTKFGKIVERLATVAFWMTIGLPSSTIIVKAMATNGIIDTFWAPIWLRIANRIILVSTSFFFEIYSMIQHWAKNPKSYAKKAFRNGKLWLFKVYAVGQMINANLFIWPEKCTIAIQTIELLLMFCQAEWLGINHVIVEYLS